MAGDAEAGFLPGGEEQVGPGPAVEADAETVRFEDGVHLGEGWFEPGGVVVIGDGAAVAALVARDVGRIGEDEIDAGRRHGGHSGAARGMSYGKVLPAGGIDGGFSAWDFMNDKGRYLS